MDARPETDTTVLDDTDSTIGAGPDAVSDSSDGGADGETCAESVLAGDSFEALDVGARPSGWALACFGAPYRAEASDTAWSGTRSLELDFRGGTFESAVALEFTLPRSGVLRIAFAMQVFQRDHNVYALVSVDDQRMFNALPFDRFGSFQETSRPYQVGIWYELEYLVDLDAERYSMRVDGVEFREGPFARSAVPCGLGDGARFSIHGGYVDQKILVRLDSVVISHLPCGAAP